MRVLLPLSKKKSNNNGEEEGDEEEYEFEYYSDDSSELDEEEDEYHLLDTVGEGAAAPTTPIVAAAPAVTVVATIAESSLPAQESTAIPVVSFSTSGESPTAETDAVSSSSPDIVTQNRSTALFHSPATLYSQPLQQHFPREEADQKLPGVCSLKRKELHVSPSELKPPAAASAAPRTTAPTPTDCSAAAAPTAKTGQRAEPSLYYDKRHSTRTESKKRPSHHSSSHNTTCTNSTSDERQCKKKKPPPSSSSSAAPTIGPVAAAALPSTSTTTASLESGSTARTTTTSTADTKMTAPRNYKHDDEDEQMRNNSTHGCYYVEENEPPPVYEPNPVPGVAHATATNAAISHAAAAVAGGPLPDPAVHVRCPLVSHQNDNRKMSGSKKSAQDVPPAAAAAAMPQDPTVNNDGNNGIEAAFCAALKRQGLEVVIQEGDGNCLFRAVSLQVYGDASMHEQVRNQCLDFMAANGDHFGQFVTGEAFADYLQRKRRLGVHGNNPEIQAISELFNRPVEVYEDADAKLVKVNSQGHLVPMNIFQTGYKTSDAPIRLSYHDGNHYNAVIDPLLPTAGLGLGLPGLKPGLADQLQVASAKVESDHTMDLERAVKESREEQLKGQEDELQRALKESSYSMDTMYQHKAMALSDIDATNFELEQAVVESSLQTWLQTEHGRKKRASPVGAARVRRRSQQQQQPTPPLQPPLRASLSTTDDSADGPADGPASVAHSAVASGVARSAAAASASFPSVASVPAAAAAASAASMGVSDSAAAASSDRGSMAASADEYPFVVQELVMNGFELSKVVRAFELVGDNFDDLLSFLVSNTS